MDDFDSFLAEAAATEGGTKFRGYKPKHLDPLVRDKANFADSVVDQIEMMNDPHGGKVNSSGNRAGNMFEILPSGKVRVTVKNSITVMKITPKEFYDKDSVADAAAFLTQVAKFAADGKFDAEFKRTARKPSKKTVAKIAQANVIDGVKAANGAHAPV